MLRLRNLVLTITVLFAALLGATPQRAAAQEPVAIVEEVRSSSANVEIMEYLTVGQTISLPRADVLVLGYLGSCLRETITGGEVTVGRTQSVVRGGLVVREVVECQGGFTTLTAAEAGKSGALVFRAPSSTQTGTAAKPVTLYSASPIFTFSKPVKRLEIRRVDRPGPPLVLAVGGRALDLAKLGKSLSPGGTYEARAGSRSQVFAIAAHAYPREGSMIGRLVRF